MAVVPVTAEEACASLGYDLELPDVWHALRDLWPCPGGYQMSALAGMGGNTFVGDHLLLDVSFDAARARLGRLAGDGVLLGASECAYREWITGLAEAAGPAAGMSRLAGVRPGDLAETQDCAHLWLRWDAIGPDGAVFPALDADLTLSPAGEKTTALTLAGVYRLPDQAGAGLDPAIVRCFAALTVRSFIARLGCALTHPAGAALPVVPAGKDSPRRLSGREMP